MKLTLDAVGDARVEAEFRQGGSRLRGEVDRTVVEQAAAIRGYIVTNLLSGQMLKIRGKGSRGIRNDMRFRVRRGEDGVLAEIHPKPNSPLWILGSGFARQEILVTRRATREQRKMVRGRRYWRKRLRAVVGTYKREHQIRKVPFMEMAYQQFKDITMGELKLAVGRGTLKIQESLGDAGGF